MKPTPSYRPPATSETSRRSMIANSSRESAVECELRSVLFRRGLRFRKHHRVLPKVRCRPDIVFPRSRIVVFVDGCFWHRCPKHGTDPDQNGAWWRAKLDANVARDRRNDKSLAAAGWTVLRFWEHEDVSSMATRIECEVKLGNTL